MHKMLRAIFLVFIIFANLQCSSGIEFDPHKAMELLGELIAHPIEVMEQLEKYKTSDLIAALGIHSNANYSISQECHEELSFLGYGVIDAARYARHHSTAAVPASMTDQERKDYLIPMMDAAGKLGSGIVRGHILSTGAFSECKSIQMFSSSLNRTVQGDYYRILFDMKMRPNSFNSSCNLPQIGVDLCLPWSCRNEDLTGYFREALGPSKALSPVCSVRNVNQRVPVISLGTWIVLLILSLIVGLCILSGFSDIFQKFQLNDKTRKEEGFGWKLFSAFSFHRNLKEIFNTKNCHKEGQVTSLNCIRVISTFWVIFGHCSEITFMVITNPIDLYDFTKDTYTGTLISNAYFSVDTFFFISAFLLSFLWFKQLEKQWNALLSPGGWLMFYVHRIARLSPVYYVTILFFTFVFTRSMVDMPAFMTPAVVDDTCQNSYWVNLLYIQNIVGPKDICYFISWYLATDLQIYIMSPLILLSFGLGGAVVGLLISTAAFLASTAFNAYQMIFWHFPPSDYNYGPKDPLYDPSKRRYAAWNYHNPLIRCQIYIMGMVLGYFMRRIPKININPWVDRIMWCLSLGSMIFVIVIMEDYTSGHLWSPLQTALYSCFSRVVWGLALSWIVISTYYRKGLINKFMSLPVWTPLARLSFCAYLVHLMVAAYFFGRNHSELYFSTLPYFVLVIAIPVISCSFLVAIFWSTMFELPFAKVEALLLGGGSRSSAPDIPKTPIDFPENNFEKNVESIRF
ncbi:Nose resistant-to-fluoxetine protein N-terminal domain-containing protein [Caenorhabditis elegans]|uniref:Nose resistant-to-fluoxetine protein N-terminal domain-containing protein n=1 Tax=Caenorhabditis elegans TaxID=6239 RepID=Q9N3Z2_CAEEL|nr:Nose resistant-to-fluoxetine protein N-terminal domain-containing protein [Caenorhabditis elegans]CCD73283.1 Nose resistant-to-fluoxetine protein N-terminal domain-containing protein [Caenorhabditis elegans]|eukprot:NP_504041.1 O-ACyltransferase homolog [Caenorhabditis elegans]